MPFVPWESYDGNPWNFSVDFVGRMRSQRCLMFTGANCDHHGVFFTTYIRQDDDPPSGRLVICNGHGCVV